MGLTKKAAKTRQKLLDTASRLINERGFDDISVEDITRESGVAKGTFYHYFHSKNELVFELSYPTAAKIAKESIHMEGGAVERCYHYIMESYKDAEYHGVHLCRQWIKDSVESEEISGDTRDALTWVYKTLEEILTSRQGKGPGELREDAPIVMICRIMVSHFVGAITVWCMLRGTVSLHETGEYLMVDIKMLLEPYLIRK